LGSAAALTGRIRKEAHRLGFVRVGFAPAGVSDGAGRLHEWLRKGFHGHMAWMERDPAQRADPRRLFPGARTVIAAAMSYHSEESAPAGPLHAVLSCYAWGDDYHELVRDRLAALLRYIRELEPAARGKVCVDTSPVLEKTWAARAGVGWQGKHSNTILREAGCWTFLGEILLNLPLSYDGPARDHCGTCTRCIEACPTGAIVEPYVVDSRRCISYLNIELRGPIPPTLRQLMGNRVFGCDDCLDACPWNRFRRPTPLAGFRPRPENRRPPLAALASLGPDEFRGRFGRGPVQRARYEGFLRNVAVALGNSGIPEAVRPLQTLIDHPAALVRSHAAWALGRIGGKKAGEILRRRQERETDPEATGEIASALESVECGGSTRKRGGRDPGL
jgi:epoxyqueuosine reductase